MPSTKPGRRPGSPATRDAILRAARESFAAAGFERATIRDIAARAGVDPALVMHFFGSKDGLFSAAMALPVDPAQFSTLIFGSGIQDAGKRLAEAFLLLWETEPFADQVRGILRAAVSHEAAAASLRAFIEGQILGFAASYVGDEGSLRVELAASHLVGLALARYIVKAEPLASMPRASIVAIVGPVLQGYLERDPTKPSEAHDERPQ